MMNRREMPLRRVLTPLIWLLLLQRLKIFLVSDNYYSEQRFICEYQLSLTGYNSMIRDMRDTAVSPFLPRVKSLCGGSMTEQSYPYKGDIPVDG